VFGGEVAAGFVVEGGDGGGSGVGEVDVHGSYRGRIRGAVKRKFRSPERRR
jgi:hypothetical protein